MIERMEAEEGVRDMSFGNDKQEAEPEVDAPEDKNPKQNGANHAANASRIIQR